MVLDVLVGAPWLVALLWGMLSLWDFVATMLYSKTYQESLNKTITYEGGLEMNPSFEKDVGELRWLSPRYALSMLSVAFLLVLGGFWLPQAWFEGVAGAALLLVLVTDFRHIENLSVVGMMRKNPESLQGRIQQSYAFSQRRVAIGTFTTGLLFLIIMLLTERVFFLGGALICGMYAIRHYLLANRQISRSSPVGK